MSNPYRKQAADDESRLDRVLEARMIIEAEAAQGGQRAEALQARLLSHYEEQGGLDVDSQIEGLMPRAITTSLCTPIAGSTAWTRSS